MCVCVCVCGVCGVCAWKVSVCRVLQASLLCIATRFCECEGGRGAARGVQCFEIPVKVNLEGNMTVNTKFSVEKLQ